MPTYGWVYERFSDAFYANQPALADAPRPAPVYRCPFCTVVRDSAASLDAHVGADHSVSRPFLLIDGQEPAKQSVRRTPILLRDVHLRNCSGLTIRIEDRDPATLAPSGLAQILSGLRREHVELTLTNAAKADVPGASESYRLLFRIADAATVQRVERAFADFITPATLSVNSVQSFLYDDRCTGEGSDYADALGRYAMGIIRKEDPQSAQLTTHSQLYREDYVLAEEGLRQLARPLARLVTKIIRFALNDFSSEPLDTGFLDLDLACALLKNPLDYVSSSPVGAEQRRNVCPIDHQTGQIITLAMRMCRQERWSDLLSDECRLVATSSSLDAPDQQKAAAIWAACAWRLGAKGDAVEPLSTISATYPFSLWAGPLLEKCAT